MDEVQKIVPGTIDVLVGAMKDRGFFTYYPEVPSEKDKIETFPTSELVFILVSDIGSDAMINLLLTYGDRELIPQTTIRQEVKRTLDEQWKKLEFGKVVNEVIPYLPLEQSHIAQVLRLKIDDMSLEFSSVYWLDLVVDEQVIRYLSSGSFIPYLQYKTAKGNKTLTFSKYGARIVDHAGPMQDLRSLLMTYMPPWRPSQVLVVKVDAFEEDKQQKGYDPNIMLQWCAVDAQSYSTQYKLGHGNKFSTCELRWKGKMPTR